MKKLLCAVLISCLLLCLWGCGGSQAPPGKAGTLYYHDTPVTDQQVTVWEDRAHLPLVKLLESMGALVQWENGTITAVTMEGHTYIPVLDPSPGSTIYHCEAVGQELIVDNVTAVSLFQLLDREENPFVLECIVDYEKAMVSTYLSRKYTYETAGDGLRLLKHYDHGELTVTVPDRLEGVPVTVLGKDAFYQHKILETVILPDTLTTIEGSPFYRCYSLEEVIIPQGVNAIDANPFFRCSTLSRIKVAEGNAHYTAVDGVLFDKDKTVLWAYPEGKPDTGYTIPDTVRKLNGDSFGYDTRLETLTVPSSVTEFPEGNMFVFPDQITLLVEKGSAAERYAKTHALAHRYIEN